MTQMRREFLKEVVLYRSRARESKQSGAHFVSQLDLAFFEEYSHLTKESKLLEDGTVGQNPDYVSEAARECFVEAQNRVKQTYLDHLNMLYKANNELEAKIVGFQKLCELGNQEINLNEMTIDAIVQRLGVIVKSLKKIPDEEKAKQIWDSIESYCGKGYLSNLVVDLFGFDPEQMGNLIKKFEKKLSEIKHECQEVQKVNNVKIYQLWNAEKDYQKIAFEEVKDIQNAYFNEQQKLFQQIKQQVEAGCAQRILEINQKHSDQLEKLRALHGQSKTEYVNMLEDQTDNQEIEISNLHYDIIKREEERRMLKRVGMQQLAAFHAIKLQIANYKFQRDKSDDRATHQEKLIVVKQEYIELLEKELDRLNHQMNCAKEIHEDLQSIKINPLSELRKLQAQTECTIKSDAYTSYCEKSQNTVGHQQVMTDLFDLNDKLGWANSYIPNKHKIPAKDQGVLAKVKIYNNGSQYRASDTDQSVSTNLKMTDIEEFETKIMQFEAEIVKSHRKMEEDAFKIDSSRKEYENLQVKYEELVQDSQDLKDSYEREFQEQANQLKLIQTKLDTQEAKLEEAQSQIELLQRENYELKTQLSQKQSHKHKVRHSIRSNKGGDQQSQDSSRSSANSKRRSVKVVHKKKVSGVTQNDSYRNFEKQPIISSADDQDASNDLPEHNNIIIDDPQGKPQMNLNLKFGLLEDHQSQRSHFGADSQHNNVNQQNQTDSLSHRSSHKLTNLMLPRKTLASSNRSQSAHSGDGVGQNTSNQGFYVQANSNDQYLKRPASSRQQSARNEHDSTVAPGKHQLLENYQSQELSIHENTEIVYTKVHQDYQLQDRSRSIMRRVSEGTHSTVQNNDPDQLVEYNKDLESYKRTGRPLRAGKEHLKGFKKPKNNIIVQPYNLKALEHYMNQFDRKKLQKSVGTQTFTRADSYRNPTPTYSSYQQMQQLQNENQNNTNKNQRCRSAQPRHYHQTQQTQSQSVLNCNNNQRYLNSKPTSPNSLNSQENPNPLVKIQTKHQRNPSQCTSQSTKNNNNFWYQTRNKQKNYQSSDQSNFDQTRNKNNNFSDDITQAQSNLIQTSVDSVSYDQMRRFSEKVLDLHPNTCKASQRKSSGNSKRPLTGLVLKHRQNLIQSFREPGAEERLETEIAKMKELKRQMKENRTYTKQSFQLKSKQINL